MARTRSPDSIEAEKMYKDGMKLVDIAKKIGKPEGTVRRWKSTQNWDGVADKKGKKKQSERPEKNNPSVRKKKGGQPGNKNAAGHAPSVPYGNTNALKHGGYSQIYWDTLTEEEKELIETQPEDEEEMLIHQIMLFSVRERRLMKAINQYKEAKGGIYMAATLQREGKRRFKDDEEKLLYEERVKKEVQAEKRMPGEFYTITTETSSTIDLVARLEKELTTVQSKKTKAIDSLTRLRLEKQKIAGESASSDAVRLWAEKVKEMRGGSNG